MRIPTNARWSRCSNTLHATSRSANTNASSVGERCFVVSITVAVVANIQSSESGSNRSRDWLGQMGCTLNLQWFGSFGDDSGSTSMQNAFVWNARRKNKTNTEYQYSARHSSGAGCGFRISATSKTQSTGNTLKKSQCASKPPNTDAYASHSLCEYARRPSPCRAPLRPHDPFLNQSAICPSSCEKARFSAASPSRSLCLSPPTPSPSADDAAASSRLAPARLALAWRRTPNRPAREPGPFEPSASSACDSIPGSSMRSFTSWTGYTAGSSKCASVSRTLSTRRRTLPLNLDHPDCLDARISSRRASCSASDSSAVSTGSLGSLSVLCPPFCVYECTTNTYAVPGVRSTISTSPR